MEDAKKLIYGFIEDEYKGKIIIHTDRDGEEADRFIDNFYEKYLGPEVRSTLVRPFSPPEHFFWPNNPKFFETAFRKRDLIQIAKIVISEQTYYGSFTSDIYYYVGEPVVSHLFIVGQDKSKIVSHYMIDREPEPHWWFSDGQELSLDQARLVEIDQIVSNISEESSSFLTQDFLNKKITSTSR